MADGFQCRSTQTSDLYWTELKTTVQKKILTIDINKHLSGKKIMFTKNQHKNQNAKNI